MSINLYESIIKSIIIKRNNIRITLFVKYLFLCIASILLINNGIWRKNSSILDILEHNHLSHFNISEIKNDKDREIFLKNTTNFYFNSRTKYLLKFNIIYNESKLETIQDKLSWLDIHESPLYKSYVVDKIKLHEYSKKVLGKDICVPIIKIYKDTDEINLNELPDKFVMKCNHGSGMNIICNNKTKLNLTKIKKKLNDWKNINYGLFTTEFQYLYVKRQIYVETFLCLDLIDYKIYCFNGEPEFIMTKKVLDHNIINNYYDKNWKLTELETAKKDHIRDPNYIIKKPKHLNLMLKYAKLLSEEFVFVRVDLYEYKNKIYLGELTFTPFNGFKKWKNKKDNIRIANLLNIKKVKAFLFNK